MTHKSRTQANHFNNEQMAGLGGDFLRSCLFSLWIVYLLMPKMIVRIADKIRANTKLLHDIFELGWQGIKTLCCTGRDARLRENDDHGVIKKIGVPSLGIPLASVSLTSRMWISAVLTNELQVKGSTVKAKVKGFIQGNHDLLKSKRSRDAHVVFISWVDQGAARVLPDGMANIKNEINSINSELLATHLMLTCVSVSLPCLLWICRVPHGMPERKGSQRAGKQ